MTKRTIAEIEALLADNTSGNISPGDLRDAVDSLNNAGWAQYADTQYTVSSPFSLSADTDTLIPNNSGATITTYLPSDVTSFYDGSTISGRTGDSGNITVTFKALPTSANTTFIEVWFDIGGSEGELYRTLFSFPKGNGVLRTISLSQGYYNLSTWEANGATMYVRSNGTANIYGVRYVIDRTSRGSLTS